MARTSSSNDTWAQVEFVVSLMRAMSEAAPETVHSIDSIRNMTVEQLAQRYAGLGLRVEYLPSKRVE